MLSRSLSSGKLATRREVLRAGGLLAGAALVRNFFPSTGFPFSAPANSQQESGGTADPVAQMRAQMAAIPLQKLKLRDNLTLLYGPGGNMVALDGAEGKVLVDSSFASVAPKLREALDAISGNPLRVLINTHWHFDHTDGNAMLTL